MKYLTLEQIVSEQKKLIDKFGGSHGIRDLNLLESAYSNSLQSYGGIDLYPSLEEKVSCLSFGIAKNHPFIDGNKRIATYVLLVTMALNGIEINCTNDDLVELGLNIAQDYSKEDILLWIEKHSK